MSNQLPEKKRGKKEDISGMKMKTQFLLINVTHGDETILLHKGSSHSPMYHRIRHTL